MDSVKLSRALAAVPCFVGVFSRDTLPTIATRPAALIVNTDKTTDPGTHWLAIYLDTDRRGEFFDPFGLPPLFKELFHFLENHCPAGYRYNTQTLQNVALQSTTCGQYCLLYVFLRCKGYAFNDMLTLFSGTNTALNDLLVRCYTGY